MNKPYKVAVIGAAGHVGCPFAILNAVAGNDVIGIDTNVNAVMSLNGGTMPFKEDKGQEYLDEAMHKGNIGFSTDNSLIKDCDVICIMIGTPVDEEGNPRLDGILKCAEQIAPYVSKNAIVILRSTVSLGCTKIFSDKLWKEIIDKQTNFRRKPIVAFCPERVAQGSSLKETEYLPQIIGVENSADFETVKDYINSFNKYNSTTIIPLECLTYKEAEMAKLMTNMYRYVNFALANEFYMIAAKENVNIEKVIRNEHGTAWTKCWRTLLIQGR